MAVSGVDIDIKGRLSELRELHGDTVAIENIAGVVESIMVSMKGDLTASDLALYNELEALAQYIHDAKTDIAALRPDEVTDDYIPTASDELDAIVSATESATNTIMDSVEIVEEVMGSLEGENADKLMMATTQIYEACGFQDITGQRITKIVKALKDIEEKIDALVKAFGSEIAKVKEEQARKKPAVDDGGADISDEDLLNGPQMTEEAKSQDDIDALLASFD